MVASIPYDPLSRFAGLRPDDLARIDRREFPSHLDPALADLVDALEQRHACLFVVYARKAVDGEHQLCRYAEAVRLPADAISHVQRLERDFDVWLVAYHRAPRRDPHL